MALVTLAGARVSAGYTQQSFAEKLGVSRALVANWENGKAKMRPINLYAICHLTGFNESEILLPDNNAKRDIAIG